MSDSSLNILGEWLQIKLPSPIILKSFSLQNRDSAIDRFPKFFQLVGSNVPTTWYTITTITLESNPVNGRNLVPFYTNENTTPYNYYRLITTGTFGGEVVNLSQFNFISITSSRWERE